MVFSSNIFLFLFLPVVLAGYYLLNPIFRNTWLLLASLFFYFWGEPQNILIMASSIIINYSFGLLIHINHNKQSVIRRLVLTAAIGANLGLLFWFKYFDFAVNIVNQLFSFNFEFRNIALPIGISFFTFQGITYLADLHKGTIHVQKNPLKVALYISLFPQLVAGPIVRYKDIEEQISFRRSSLELVYSGLSRFITGLAKKMLIANNLAIVADQIFGLPYSEISMKTAWFGIICYSFQIYFDFSGYSDMAIGLGRMFGFKFLENFNYPYMSKTITEFWRRWHISLSSFFRDYVYIPLGGNRKGNTYMHLLVVFLVTGLWHGASWSFIVWGLWHGLFIILERLLRGRKEFFSHRALVPLGHLYTMAVVMVGWVFFRAENLDYAVGYLKIMFCLESPDLSQIGFSLRYYLDKYNVAIVLAAAVGSMPVIPWLNSMAERLAIWPAVVTLGRNICLSALLLLSFIMVLSSSYNPFIYFRF